MANNKKSIEENKLKDIIYQFCLQPKERWQVQCTEKDAIYFHVAETLKTKNTAKFKKSVDNAIQSLVAEAKLDNYRYRGMAQDVHIGYCQYEGSSDKQKEEIANALKTAGENGKYGFTGETMEYNGHTLHRIMAVKDFVNRPTEKYLNGETMTNASSNLDYVVHNVRFGDKGGWIENESNLSQIDDSWVASGKVFGSAKIFDNAFVGSPDITYYNRTCEPVICGNAKVHDMAIVNDGNVYDNADIAGTAKVTLSGCVYDNAVVLGGEINGGKVFGNATVVGGYVIGKVYDNATTSCYVQKHAKVFGNAKVLGIVDLQDDVSVYGNAHISSNAEKYYMGIEIKGNAQIYDDAEISGTEIKIRDNVHIHGKAKIGSNFNAHGNDDLSEDKVYVINEKDFKKFDENDIKSGRRIQKFSDFNTISSDEIVVGVDRKTNKVVTMYDDFRLGYSDKGEEQEAKSFAFVFKNANDLDLVVLKSDFLRTNESFEKNSLFDKNVLAEENKTLISRDFFASFDDTGYEAKVDFTYKFPLSELKNSSLNLRQKDAEHLAVEYIGKKIYEDVIEKSSFLNQDFETNSRVLWITPDTNAENNNDIRVAITPGVDIKDKTASIDVEIHGSFRTDGENSYLSLSDLKKDEIPLVRTTKAIQDGMKEFAEKNLSHPEQMEYPPILPVLKYDDWKRRLTMSSKSNNTKETFLTKAQWGLVNVGNQYVRDNNIRRKDGELMLFNKNSQDKRKALSSWMSLLEKRGFKKINEKNLE